MRTAKLKTRTYWWGEAVPSTWGNENADSMALLSLNPVFKSLIVMGIGIYLLCDLLGLVIQKGFFPELLSTGEFRMGCAGMLLISLAIVLLRQFHIYIFDWKDKTLTCYYWQPWGIRILRETVSFSEFKKVILTLHAKSYEDDMNTGGIALEAEDGRMLRILKTPNTSEATRLSNVFAERIGCPWERFNDYEQAVVEHDASQSFESSPHSEKIPGNRISLTCQPQGVTLAIRRTPLTLFNFLTFVFGIVWWGGLITMMMQNFSRIQTAPNPETMLGNLMVALIFLVGSGYLTFGILHDAFHTTRLFIMDGKITIQKRLFFWPIEAKKVFAANIQRIEAKTGNAQYWYVGLDSKSDEKTMVIASSLTREEAEWLAHFLESRLIPAVAR